MSAYNPKDWELEYAEEEIESMLTSAGRKKQALIERHHLKDRVVLLDLDDTLWTVYNETGVASSCEGELEYLGHGIFATVLKHGGEEEVTCILKVNKNIVDLVKRLKDAGFGVYVVSQNDPEPTRTLAEGVLKHYGIEIDGFAIGWEDKGAMVRRLFKGSQPRAALILDDNKDNLLSMSRALGRPATLGADATLSVIAAQPASIHRGLIGRLVERIKALAGL